MKEKNEKIDQKEAQLESLRKFHESQIKEKNSQLSEKEAEL